MPGQEGIAGTGPSYAERTGPLQRTPRPGHDEKWPIPGWDHLRPAAHEWPARPTGARETPGTVAPATAGWPRSGGGDATSTWWPPGLARRPAGQPSAGAVQPLLQWQCRRLRARRPQLQTDPAHPRCARFAAAAAADWELRPPLWQLHSWAGGSPVARTTEMATRRVMWQERNVTRGHSALSSVLG